MLLRNTMTATVAHIPADAPLIQAAKTMKHLDVRAIPVGESDRLVGMITDRDITVRAVAEGCDPQSTVVREAMSRDIDGDVTERPIESPMRVRLLAYLLWQERGSPLESPDEDWFEAERVLGVRAAEETGSFFAFGVELLTS